MKNTNTPIIAYKGFDKDLKCNGFQYEVGKTYEMDENISVCNRGFHACTFPLDVFRYYFLADSRFCQVEQQGAIEKRNDDSKLASSKIHIQAELGLSGVINAGIKFIIDKINWKDNKKSNTGDYSAATNTGNRSAATNTGNRSAATNTGDYSAATNTGNYSAATNTGYRSAATNTGDCSVATNTSYRSAATNTGDYSAATNTGNCSAATNTGDRSAAIVEGKDSIAFVSGGKSKAKGALGCWLVLTERDDDGHILSVKAVKVDGETIKPDTFYQLIDNNIVEAYD